MILVGEARDVACSLDPLSESHSQEDGEGPVLATTQEAYETVREHDRAPELKHGLVSSMIPLRNMAYSHDCDEGG